MRRGVRGLTVLVLCAALLLPALCTALLAGHDCQMHDCPICPVLGRCRELMSQLCLRSDAAGRMVQSLMLRPRADAFARHLTAQQTPVTLKVKLLD